MKKELKQITFEIRYEPNSRFLDKRGETASSIAGNLLEHWNITENRVNFFSDENKYLNAFFSYKNLGLTSESPNDDDIFVDNSKKFIKKAWIHFPSDKILRVGARSTYLVEIENEEKIRAFFNKRFLNIQTTIKKDEFNKVGFSAEFIDGSDTIFLKIDTVKSFESKKMFKDVSDEEQTISGLIIDIDCFRENLPVHTKQKDLSDFISNAITKENKLKKEFLSQLLGNNN